MKTLILLFTFYTLGIHACEIQFKTHNYFLPGEARAEELIEKKSDCGDKTIALLTDFIKDYHGSVSTRYLEALAGGVKISPERVSFFNIEKILEQKIDNSRFKIGKTKLLFHQKNISSNEIIKINCDKCNQPGEFQFGLKDNNTTIWGKVQILQESAVLVSKTNLKAFSNDFNQDQFNLRKKWVLNPENYFYNKSELDFYKLNKPIHEGESLEKSSLMPKNIVHYGKKVEVTIMSKSVRIVTQAVARSSGHHLDDILVENLKTKKKYSAKIIGINKVKVDL